MSFVGGVEAFSIRLLRLRACGFGVRLKKGVLFILGFSILVLGHAVVPLLARVPACLLFGVPMAPSIRNLRREKETEASTQPYEPYKP